MNQPPPVLIPKFPTFVKPVFELFDELTGQYLCGTFEPAVAAKLQNEFEAKCEMQVCIRRRWAVLLPPEFQPPGEPAIAVEDLPQ